ncbi:hypothetical protein H0H81_005664 [Sphagnurus paluster]|uniref:Carbonic anhydrase n=1 Tax=Sphagnurus paluster TaxID=117069 RepID=A0A9P7FXM3_9AGAR|nr:hypothetical protein H0H81_005664 [Sphagnurus paluster]
MAHQHEALAALLSTNAQWAKDVARAEPGFFEKSAKGQAPLVGPFLIANDPNAKNPEQTLWIGCADSRVPETVITGARPGEIFVHRNIANQFPIDDVSGVAVLTYAVDFLGVQHVVVVGHSECGGAAACLGAVQDPSFSEYGPIATISKLPPSDPLNRWLEPLTRHAASLNLSNTPKAQALPIIVDENVKRQVENLSKTRTLVNAWAANKKVWVHGWVYDLATGRLRDLNVTKGPAA